jgi:hypothetical protein
MYKEWKYYCHLEHCIRRSLFERGLKRRPYVRDRRTTVYFFRMWLAVVEDLVIERENHLAIITTCKVVRLCTFVFVSVLLLLGEMAESRILTFIGVCLS